MNKLINYFTNIYQAWQFKRQQSRWQRAIDVPEGTGFCPLLYESCIKVGHDSNCFTTKAPGCYTFRKHLQDKDPKALVTAEYCREYLAGNGIEDIIQI